MDKFYFFILNIFINSLLAFLTVAFLIEGIIFLLRVRQGRLASCLRIIPMIKLPLDLFFYNFSNWSYNHGINPLLCEKGSRTISIMLGYMNYMPCSFFPKISCSIQMSVFENLTFTVADIIGQIVSLNSLKYFTLIFLMLCAYSLIKKLLNFLSSKKEINHLKENSYLKSIKIKNPSLKAFFKKKKIQVISCVSYFESPFVSGFNSNIYIPENFTKNLSRKEQEAVLAHEIEHIKHKDNLVRLTLDLIGSFFWWVPTKWLQRRIRKGQEFSCDLNSLRFGVNPVDLASAIYKSKKNTLNKVEQSFTNYFSKNNIYYRINILLQPELTRFKKMRLILTCLAIGVSYSAILFGRFWTF